MVKHPSNAFRMEPAITFRASDPLVITASVSVLAQEAARLNLVAVTVPFVLFRRRQIGALF